MKLMRIGHPGKEMPVVIGEDGTPRSIRSITAEIDGDFFARDGVERVRQALAEDRLEPMKIDGFRIGAPIARPSAVLCIGMNYAAHAAESGNAAPAIPIMFYKAPNTVVGPNDTVLIPRKSTKTDWEVELGVVIGRRARYLESPDEALSYVAGYVLSNDVSEREFQLETSGGQWSKGKSCETFNPVGPWLLTADEVPDPQTLALQSWVNGEIRQNSSTADMVFSVAELIYQLSQVTVLEPGDLLNTGTPEGVAMSGRFPYLAPGDQMELEISGLGRQRQLLEQA
jgi:2-keto-4-pentenoate hydratase/2-oxohepta-3-ene-1,7-dioic acid hydratase in catechol pathway